jgi:hypothetical protein
MSDPVQDLAQKITPRLADPDEHGLMLKDLLEVAQTEGAKGLKKLIKAWVAAAKEKEGVE